MTIILTEQAVRRKRDLLRSAIHRFDAVAGSIKQKMVKIKRRKQNGKSDSCFGS